MRLCAVRIVGLGSAELVQGHDRAAVAMTLGGPSKFWVLPKDMMNKVNAEFKFDFDPAPFVADGLLPQDGLGPWPSNVKSVWLNPLFGSGITAWVRKAIEENQKGKSVVTILPLDNWVRLFIEAGAEIRSLGSHDWVNPETGEQRKSSRPSFLFILRAKPIPRIAA